MFGLTEEQSEDLDSKISSVFSDMDMEEKPSFEAVRIGEQSEETTRPVSATRKPFTGFFRRLKTSGNLLHTGQFMFNRTDRPRSGLSIGN